jgi:hypothetical protein
MPKPTTDNQQQTTNNFSPVATRRIAYRLLFVNLSFGFDLAFEL